MGRLKFSIILAITGLFLFSCSEGVDMSVKITSEEDHKLYTLPDGSKVWLNKGSELAHGKSIKTEDGERVVKIKGEAYFDISRDPDNPFVVQSGSAKTRTTGAKMNVKANGDGNVEVAVQEGKATFDDGKKVTQMKEGTSIAFNEKSGEVKKSEGNSLNAFAWLTKRIVFKDTKFSKIMDDISKFFKLEFAVSNPAIMNCKFTGTFPEPKVDEILEVMAISMNLEIEKEGKKVTFKGEGCN